MKISCARWLLLGGGLLLCSTAWAQPPAAVALGNYKCWGHGAPRLLLNLKVTAKDRYSDPTGQKSGTFVYTPSTGSIEFKGGHLGNVMPKGFTSIYHEPHNNPTVSFRSGRGVEASFCQRSTK